MSCTRAALAILILFGPAGVFAQTERPRDAQAPPPQNLVVIDAPIELAFDLFMVNPEDVCGDNVHACSLHLQDLVLPVLRGIPREVKLPHDRKHWLAVQGKKTAVHLEVVSG